MQLQREYIWMGSTPVAVVEGGQVYYIRTDHIGRPVFATDGTGVKVWEASYLRFGEMHSPPHMPKSAIREAGEASAGLAD